LRDRDLRVLQRETRETFTLRYGGCGARMRYNQNHGSECSHDIRESESVIRESIGHVGCLVRGSERK